VTIPILLLASIESPCTAGEQCESVQPTLARHSSSTPLAVIYWTCRRVSPFAGLGDSRAVMALKRSCRAGASMPSLTALPLSTWRRSAAKDVRPVGVTERSSRAQGGCVCYIVELVRFQDGAAHPLYD